MIDLNIEKSCLKWNGSCSSTYDAVENDFRKITIVKSLVSSKITHVLLS